MIKTTWTRHRWLSFLLGALLMASPAGPDGGSAPDRPVDEIASTFQGVVLDASSREPIASATVRLLDSAGERRAGAFTDQEGHFSLSVLPRVGDVLHVERLGFAPSVHPFEADVEAGAVRLEVRLESRPLTLSAIEVRGSRCESVPGDDGQTHELWEAARTGLRAAELSETEGLVLYRARNWEREESGARDVLEVVSDEESFVSGQPFRTLTAQALAREGYVVDTGEGERIAYGPGAKVLLSEEFIATHCFRVYPPESNDIQAAEEGWVGLAFEPAPEPTDAVRLDGVLWLDPATGELRSIEFEYRQWIPRREAWAPWLHNSGGQIDYRVLKDGRWVIDQWFIRVLTRLGANGGVYAVAGGNLLEVMPADGPN